MTMERYTRDEIDRMVRDGEWGEEEKSSTYREGADDDTGTDFIELRGRSYSRSALAERPTDWGKGVGEREYAINPRPPDNAVPGPPEAREAPEGGSYLTSAEQLYLSRIPVGQPSSEETVNDLLAIRRRVEGHGGRLSRHPQTVRSDLLLLNAVLAGQDTRPDERASLQQQLREVDEQLARPVNINSYVNAGADDNDSLVARTTDRAIAEVTAEENERYRRALATLPRNRWGRPDPIMTQEVEREHQAALQRIMHSRGEVLKQVESDLRRERENKWKQRTAELNGRKGQLRQKLIALGPA